MLFTFLSTFFACGCDEMLVYSVNFDLMDESGSPITDADISYTVDGEEGQTVEHWGEGSYVVGAEEAGDFEISIHATAESSDADCWREGTAELSVTIKEDRCHVDPQSLTPELEWVEVCAQL